MKHISSLIILAALFIILPQGAQAASVPKAIPYQGHLTDAQGVDLNQTVPVEVRLYDSFIAGLGGGVTNSHVVYAESHAAVNVENGIFRISIGKGNPLDAKWTELPVDGLVEKENVYLELWIDGERLSPRQRMGSVPAVIRAQYAKYADELTQIPQITEEMMPAYDAGRIDSGTFAPSQFQNLAADLFFTSGTFAPSSIPSLSADKFSTGSGKPQIAPTFLPNDMDASKIEGSPLSVDRLPVELISNEDLAFGSGTINHHEMIALPSGFNPSQCVVALSLGVTPESAENGLTYVNVTHDSNYVVTCDYKNSSGVIKNCSANYIYICKK